MRSENMVGALDQQRPEVDIASLGDAELPVVVPVLAASRPQAEVTADNARNGIPGPWRVSEDKSTFATHRAFYPVTTSSCS
jgi:hypothetical protein